MEKIKRKKKKRDNNKNKRNKYYASLGLRKD